MNTGFRIVLVSVGGLFGFIIFSVMLLGGGPDADDCGPTPSVAGAVADIPAEFVAAYQAAAQKHGLDWTILAGVGKVECDHGRYQAKGCNPPGTMNGSGARGPMQFIGSTWRRGVCQHCQAPVAAPSTSPQGGYASDGDGDGLADPWNVRDATMSSAWLLKSAGAPGDYRKAIYSYNHAWWYVDLVTGHADRYRKTAESQPAPPQPDQQTAAIGSPTAQPFKIIATPGDHAARALGNWQSDNAIDLDTPRGTQLLSVVNGTVTKVSGSPPKHSSSVIGGYSVTIAGAGNRFFYAHLLTLSVRSGQTVRQGQIIGTSGYANRVDHLHLGIEKGNPAEIWSNGTTPGTPTPDSNPQCLGGDTAPTGPTNLDEATLVKEPREYVTLPKWVGGPGRYSTKTYEVDARIAANTLYLLQEYDARLTAARETGHASHGDGLALDIIPANGSSWSKIDQLARDIGWTPQCGSSGVAPACPLKPWVRFVGYTGYPGHGSGHHLHISWQGTDRSTGHLSGPQPGVRVFPTEQRRNRRRRNPPRPRCRQRRRRACLSTTQPKEGR